MMAAETNIIGRIIGSLVLVLAYALPFWRMFKSYPGDRFIECGSMTAMVFVVTMAVVRIRYFPAWVLQSLEVLLGLLAFLSIFFMFQQGYRALRRHKTRPSD